MWSHVTLQLEQQPCALTVTVDPGCMYIERRNVSEKRCTHHDHKDILRRGLAWLPEELVAESIALPSVADRIHGDLISFPYPDTAKRPIVILFG